MPEVYQGIMPGQIWRGKVGDEGSEVWCEVFENGAVWQQAAEIPYNRLSPCTNDTIARLALQAAVESLVKERWLNQILLDAASDMIKDEDEV